MSSQNSQQTIGKTYNGFQSSACIITERLNNIQKYQSNYYLREESKVECREETTQSKADEPWPVFKEIIKIKKTNKKVLLKPYIHEAIL